MKISGFSMARNASKLYYPLRHAIESILPICDEFVVAIGSGDADDRTREEVEKIGSDKIRIIDTVWDLEKYPRGMENAHQTDIAMKACTGDWLFYVQADEVVHERFLPVIENRCQELLADQEVEGLLFDYIHFYGDYDHHHVGHDWYKKEIRIVRNLPDMHSWISAQSFRRIPDFDGLNYRVKEGTHKLRVASSGAQMFHYGWVRPPHLMQKKKKSLGTIHHGSQAMDAAYREKPIAFDYGPLGRTRKFEGTHPAVLKDWIARFDWQDQLNYSSKERGGKRELLPHDRPKSRLISWIEQNMLGGRSLGGFNNYILLDR
ncbi:MAG: Uncharacterised protein [Flavobacteriia bacterium]|nr:MAG: Uncharacterised protein [Flavobacteriia bacterium]